MPWRDGMDAGAVGQAASDVRRSLDCADCHSCKGLSGGSHRGLKAFLFSRHWRPQTQSDSRSGRCYLSVDTVQLARLDTGNMAVAAIASADDDPPSPVGDARFQAACADSAAPASQARPGSSFAPTVKETEPRRSLPPKPALRLTILSSPTTACAPPSHGR